MISIEVRPLTVKSGVVSFGSMPGRDRGAVRAQPPILDQHHLVAIDADRSRSPRRRARAPATAAPDHRRASADRTGRCRHGAAAVGSCPWPLDASGARAASGSAAGTPSMPCQLSTTGTGRSFPSVTSSWSPRLKRRPASGADVRSDHIGVSGWPGRKAAAPGLACSIRAVRPCAAAGDGIAGLEHSGAQPGQQAAPGQRENAIGH